MTLRRLQRGIARIKPWMQRTLDLLDILDWKTWVWYALLGMEQMVTTLLVHAKRRGFKPAELRVKDGKFYVAKMRVVMKHVPNQDERDAKRWSVGK